MRKPLFLESRDIKVQDRWESPATGSLKLNFDGANWVFFGATFGAGLGVVIRDYSGNLVLAMANEASVFNPLRLPIQTPPFSAPSSSTVLIRSSLVFWKRIGAEVASGADQMARAKLMFKLG